MSPKAQPKSQHWVPQFYLRYFSVDKPTSVKTPQIWALDPDDASAAPKRMAIRKVCAKRFMFTPKQDEGRRLWDLDKLLGDLEGRAAELWPKLLDGHREVQDVETRRQLAKFVAALYLRNLFFSNLISESFSLRDQLYGATPAAGIGASWSLNDPDPADAARTFAHLIWTGLPRIADNFISRNWTVLGSDTTSFLTSDCPIVSIQGKRLRPNINADDTVVMLPLSPTRALRLSGREGRFLGGVTAASAELASASNLFACVKCNQFVLSSRGDLKDPVWPDWKPVRALRRHYKARAIPRRSCL